MYTFDTPITQINGVGSSTAQKLLKHEIKTVRDLLLFAPLRYLDVSQVKTVAQIKELDQAELVSVKAKVVKTSQFRRGVKTFQTVFIADRTGQLKLLFFNSPFVLRSLKPDQTYFFSGKYSPRYKNLTQPKFEAVKEEQLHTGRLVPYYSTRLNLAQGQIRRLIKKTLSQLLETPDQVNLNQTSSLSSINQVLNKLHFPQKPSDVKSARERLALEELLSIIDYSEAAKKYLRHLNNAPAILTSEKDLNNLVKTLPFNLTSDQKQALNQVLNDISQTHPMNRLLMGDVGTGKTVVAGLAAYLTVLNNHHAALIAPTTILAKQHLVSLGKLFPELNLKLVTARSKPDIRSIKSSSLFVGTHALINQLDQLEPALVIYDEQQKFGVWQRGGRLKELTPHTLNMTATPIPRSLMLTVFAHVDLSVIKTYPNKRPPVKTWVVKKDRRKDAFGWIKKQLKKNPQTVVLVVAPFIDPSYHKALENIKAVTELFEEYRQNLPEVTIDILHSRLSKAQQVKAVQNLTQGRTQLLIATPMIEVGIDLPTANLMIVESAERFGLASLHQLRGRVGRRGQEAFCLLFTQTDQKEALERLRLFSQLQEGEKIAELDLKYRGSGDIFGTNQHGLANLKFANWLNPRLVKKAKEIYQTLPKAWSSFLTPKVKVGVEHLN